MITDWQVYIFYSIDCILLIQFKPWSDREQTTLNFNGFARKIIPYEPGCMQNKII